MPFPQKRDLAQHVAIITGASSGFGLILSRRLAAKGTRVLMADVNMSGEGVARELNSQYGQGTAVFVETDVSDPKAVQNMFDEALKTWGRLDIVVNNAGIGESTEFYSDESRSGWQKMVAVDFHPVVLGTQIAIQLAKKHKRDCVVVNTASLAGLYPQSGMVVYSMVKAAIIHMCRGMKFLGQPAESPRVRVVAVCPSFSPTGGQQRIDLPLVPPELVVDAMEHAIQDTGIFGEAIRITPENGIEVQFFSSRGNRRKLESDLPNRVPGSAEKRPDDAMTVGAGTKGKL